MNMYAEMNKITREAEYQGYCDGIRDTFECLNELAMRMEYPQSRIVLNVLKQGEELMKKEIE